MNNTKKYFIIMGALAACAVLVGLIAQQFQKDVVEDEPLPTITEEVTDVVVDITVPEQEQTDIIIIAPEVSQDTTQQEGAVDTGTEQTIQPDIPEKPTYTEEELSNPEPPSSGDTTEPPVVETPAPEESTNTGSNSGGGLPGFGDVIVGGDNQAIYVEDMYENGNKVGIMG